MIIKSKRVKARGQALKRTLQHLANGDDNDAVELIAGTVADLEDARADALRFAREYCVRHWIVSPGERISREQLSEFVDRLAFEFRFDTVEAVIWEHTKARAAEGGCNQHFHICVAEVDPITGGVLSSSHDYARHEKLARAFELAWDHVITPGRHTAAVAAVMEREDGCEAAAILREAAPLDHGQSFDATSHQRLKRAGYDLPRLREIIADALSSSTSHDQFDAKLAVVGLRVRAGDKQNTSIVETIDGSTLVGSLARLTRLRKAALAERLKFDGECSSKGNANDSSRDIRFGPANPSPDAVAVETCDQQRQHGSAGPNGHHDRPVAAGRARNRAGPHSIGESGITARRSGSGPGHQGGHVRLRFVVGCSRHQGVLLDLLAQVRSVALSPLERVTAAFDDVIECETRVYSSQVPPAPASLLAARRCVEVATERLTKLEAKADRIEKQLVRHAPAPLWLRFWPQSAETGTTAALEIRLERARRDVLAARGEQTATEQDLKTEESAYRLACARHESALPARRAQADVRIATVQAARKFLDKHPRAAFWGAQHLWKVVTQIQKARAEWRVAPDAEVSDDWSLLPIFDLWGKPYLPPP